MVIEDKLAQMEIWFVCVKMTCWLPETLGLKLRTRIKIISFSKVVHSFKAPNVLYGLNIFFIRINIIHVEFIFLILLAILISVATSCLGPHLLQLKVALIWHCFIVGICISWMSCSVSKAWWNTSVKWSHWLGITLVLICSYLMMVSSLAKPYRLHWCWIT